MSDHGTWVIFWCYDGWHPAADRLELMLAERAPWAVLRRVDPSRPLEEQVADAQVLIPTTGLLTAAAIHAARDLRLIAQPAAGYENIPVAAARARGVPVTIAPGYNSQSVAEAAVMMMLMLARKVAEAQRKFQAGVIGEPIGTELHGKTLGIVGQGRVGGGLAAAARGLGMQVVGTTSSSTRGDLERLLSTADIISVHCPSNPQTVGLLGPAEFGLMKPGAVLINCSRGDVVQKQALIDALEGGRLAGCGLDVHWVEPADPSEPLYTAYGDRVLALPHLGAATKEFYERICHVMCENIIRVREGRPLLHVLED